MVAFQNTLSIGDILNMVLLGLTVIGIFLNIHQLKRGQEAQRANFLKELYLTMLGDPGIRSAFYSIDQAKIQHDAGHFKDPSQEPQIDQLLNFADLVCELYARKMLTMREIGFFKYQFLRVYENEEIQSYLVEPRYLVDGHKPPFLKAQQDQAPPVRGVLLEPEPNPLHPHRSHWRSRRSWRLRNPTPSRPPYLPPRRFSASA